MKIILIGNYALDQQESMERFALMLENGFINNSIESEIWRPTVFFGKKSLNQNKGIGKYLGYIDKWLLFPLVLKFKTLKKTHSEKSTFFHICDHSNSPYLSYLPRYRSGITCHDVLAIRGAFGFADAYCPTSRMGAFLQKWILKNLSKAKKLVAVSHFSLNQLKDLCKDKVIEDKNWLVVHNAFNAPFEILSKEKCNNILEETSLIKDKPYILHVGSSLPRKNRKLLLDMLKHIIDSWDGYVCYAGGAIDDDLKHYAKQFGLENRMVSIVKPNHEVLVALFNACDAFIFPSFSEGFGWPLIEAQACGVPVIASDLDPMPEVSGGSAIHASPLKPKAFANAFRQLETPSFRDEVVNKGLKNIKRFSNDKMIEGYIKLYKKI